MAIFYNFLKSNPIILLLELAIINVQVNILWVLNYEIYNKSRFLILRSIINRGSDFKICNILGSRF